MQATQQPKTESVKLSAEEQKLIKRIQDLGKQAHHFVVKHSASTCCGFCGW